MSNPILEGLHEIAQGEFISIIEADKCCPKIVQIIASLLLKVFSTGISTFIVKFCTRLISPFILFSQLVKEQIIPVA